MVSAKINKLWLSLFGLLSLIGFTDASYLTLKHFLGGPIPCSLTHGCEIVTTSKYSMILGIPIALIGALYFLFLLISVIHYVQTDSMNLMKIAMRLTILAALISLILIYLQLFVLHAICIYCFGSAFINIILGIMSLLLLLA